MAADIIARSISMKFETRPGSKFRHVSAVRYVTDCAMRSGICILEKSVKNFIIFTKSTL